MTYRVEQKQNALSGSSSTCFLRLNYLHCADSSPSLFKTGQTTWVPCKWQFNHDNRKRVSGCTFISSTVVLWIRSQEKIRHREYFVYSLTFIYFLHFRFSFFLYLYISLFHPFILYFFLSYVLMFICFAKNTVLLFTYSPSFFLLLSLLSFLSSSFLPSDTYLRSKSL
jgi:hypothetical protein